MAQEFSNNGSALLASDVLAGDTTITLNPGDGNLFPLPDAGDPASFALLTLEDVNANIEITKMTGRSGDILTIERAQESTSALGFATGSRIECRLTAGSLAVFKQVGDTSFKGEGSIDVDGLNIWHETDPSTYQFFTLRYWTDLAGENVCEFEGPDIPDLVWAASIIGSDGGKRSIALGTSADSQSAGIVGFRIPGNLKFEHRTRFREQIGTWVVWDTNSDGVNEYSITPQSASADAAYKFVCRNDLADSEVGFTDAGNMYCHREIQIFHSYGVDFPDRTLKVTYDRNPFSQTEDLAFFNIEVDGIVDNPDDERAQSMWFQAREKIIPEAGDPTYHQRIGILNQRGVWMNATDSVPENAMDVTSKQYVDDLVTAATDLTGDALLPITTSVYGRTVLWNDDTGINLGTVSLATGAFDEFHSIEVTAYHAVDGSYGAITIDTATLIEKGYTGKWQIMSDPTQGDQNHSIFFGPRSLTTFEVSEAGDAGEDLRVTRILGLFPKVVL